MKELAEQELKVLEAQHPTRFQHLKLHLKEFIHHLDQQDQDPQYSFNHHSIITKESSSSRKRHREEEEEDGYTKPKPKTRSRSKRGGDGGIRDAIHKAEACLHKIRTLKSFFCSSNH
ncbi:hypothetical protein SSX86_003164 [Deinandra increscens subsp. villosa]|uniref:Uncharacterized protein n=1 Tax=Deinandra increscens subsp. villosa TaxID=3103831 RepID=A0AAP0DGQ6_9ASTR